jgi:pimeloyl-ACP methyl ester carboxylesterase
VYRTIVFAHANSFPASTYRSLFEGWHAAGYEVKALDRIGHDPHFPVTPDWPHLVEQLRDFIEREVRHPAFLVGHSLGGYLSMMVAQQHPHLAQGVVAMDSPLLSGWKAAGIGLAKRLGRMDRVMPSRISAQRTHEWPSLQDAQNHFRGKPKFAAFSPSVLSDYVFTGTEPAHDGTAIRRLRFSREVETAIYNTFPHALLQTFRRHPPRCPMAFIGGTRSTELSRVGLGGTRQLFGERLSWLEGSHLYPFEQPERTTAEVLRWLRSFEAV